MDPNSWLLLAVFVVGVVALLGFFATKTKGYGRFATSTFLILIAVIVSSLLFAGGKLDAQVMANILFAVIGFAGGLFTVKASGTQTDTSKRGASKKASEDLNAKS